MTSPPAPPVISGTRAQQVSEIESWIVSQTGNQSYGDSYAAFCASPANRNVSAKECYVGWFFQESKLAPHLMQDLGTAMGAPGRLAQASLAAIPATASPLAPLFQASLWLRVAEVVLGLVLIAVGVARLTSAVPVATQIARYVT